MRYNFHNTKTLDLKTKHEEAVCKIFLVQYNQSLNKKLKLLKIGDPGKKEPDCICSENINIELVGVYDNNYQAEKMWAVARDKIVSRQPNLQLLTFENLENEIGNKLQKLNLGNYDCFSGKIILLCNFSSPLIESKEVDRYIKSYNPFRKDGGFDRYFDEIWLMLKLENTGLYKIYRLE